MIKEIDQLLYDAIYAKIEPLTDLYVLPPEPSNVKLPYAVLGDVSIERLPAQKAMLGRIIVEIDVWASRDKRFEASNLSNRVLQELRVVKAGPYRFVLQNKQTLHQVVAEVARTSSNSTPGTNYYWRGALSLVFNVERVFLNNNNKGD